MRSCYPEKMISKCFIEVRTKECKCCVFGQFVKYVTIKAFVSGIKFLLIKMYLVLTWHKEVLVIFIPLLAWSTFPPKKPHRVRGAAHASKRQLRRDAYKNSELKSARSEWNVKHTPAWGGNVTLTQPPASPRDLFLIGRRQRAAIRGLIQMLLERRRSDLSCPRQRVNPVRSRTRSHTIRATAGDEATRLWYARILLTLCASLLRI